jgi:NAD(P)-dependent dehydrogenase (short-subunit alcohol dehydrogenase family)
MANRLTNKVCVITGAGSGMGRVACETFAHEGGRVAALDVVAEAGEETARRVRSNGGDAAAFACDVANEESVRDAVAAVVRHFGRIDVLYNNAGIMSAADHSVIDTPVDVWDQVMAVNVRGIYLCCKYVIPEMLRIGGGSIINIASFVALVGCSVPQDAYTASKGAVISLTKSLAIQFRPMGIRSNAICPGPIETPMLMDWLLKDDSAKQLRLNRQPSGRFGKPEDIVNCALYLASNDSDWTNGAVLVVDGGITSNYF